MISAALLFIKPAFHASALQLQAIIGALLVGAVAGATASGYLAEAMSRKWTKVLSGCIYVGAAMWSSSASGAAELITARFVLGLPVGTASFVTPINAATLADPASRAGLTAGDPLSGGPLGEQERKELSAVFSVREQQILRQIEDGLRADDGGFAHRFAVCLAVLRCSSPLRRKAMLAAATLVAAARIVLQSAAALLEAILKQTWLNRDASEPRTHPAGRA